MITVNEILRPISGVIFITSNCRLI